MAKLLLVTPKLKANDVSGGIASWTDRILKSKPINENYDIRIVNIRLKGKRAKGSANINYFVELYRFFSILFSFIIKLIIFNPDIVHINNNCSYGGLIRDNILIIIAKKFKVKVVVHFRCDISYYKYAVSSFSRLKNIIRLSDNYIVLNNASRKYLENFKDFKSYKCINIPNFYTLNKKIIVRYKSEIKNIAYLGRVSILKGSDIIIDVAKSFPTLEFHMIGEVSQDIKGIKDIPSNVIFHGLIKDQNKMDELMLASDLFLFPSLTEGFSNALVESMYYGLPSIVSNVGANRDMVDSKGGIVVESLESISYINSIKNIQKLPIKELNNMGNYNHNKVISCYSEEIVIKQLLATYSKLLNK